MCWTKRSRSATGRSATEVELERARVPWFSANLSFLWNELPFLDRFDAAAAAGFDAVEYMFRLRPRSRRPQRRLRANGLRQDLFNLPAGDFDAGERGLANDPSRREEFRDGVERALRYADVLDCRKVNCLVGVESVRPVGGPARLPRRGTCATPSAWGRKREAPRRAAEHEGDARVLRRVDRGRRAAPRRGRQLAPAVPVRRLPPPAIVGRPRHHRGAGPGIGHVW